MSHFIIMLGSPYARVDVGVLGADGGRRRRRRVAKRRGWLTASAGGSSVRGGAGARAARGGAKSATSLRPPPRPAHLRGTRERIRRSTLRARHSVLFAASLWVSVDRGTPHSRHQWPTSGTWPLITFDNPAPCIFPVAFRSLSRARRRCPNRWLLPPLFMLSFWCGVYLCRTNDNRIVCAPESVDIFTHRQLFLEGKCWSCFGECWSMLIVYMNRRVSSTWRPSRRALERHVLEMDTGYHGYYIYMGFSRINNLLDTVSN